MSTKIYNGRKLKDKPKNLKEVRDIIFKFKEKAIEYYRKKYYSLVACDIVEMFDNAILTNKVLYEFPHRFEDKKKVPFLDQSPISSLWGLISNSVDRKSELERKSYRKSLRKPHCLRWG